MKIIFFETETWQQEYLTKKLPKNLSFEFYEQPLNDDSTIDISDAEAVSVFVYSQIHEKILKQCPKLQFITTRSTGYDHIDIWSCDKRDIKIANVPAYGENTVAEHVFALILGLSSKIVQSVEKVRHGDFTADGLRGFDLFGKTIGIIGTGKIGTNVARIANSFGMKILAYDKFKKPELERKYKVKYVSLNKLLVGSQIISLNLNHTAETHHIINKESLSKVKKGAYLINTARGGLIDTTALLDALDKGIIAGAGLDVLEEEGSIKEDMMLLSKQYPKRFLMLSVANNILMRHPNVIITPHNAFNSVEAMKRILDTTVDNIKAFEKGEALNLVKVK